MKFKPIAPQELKAKINVAAQQEREVVEHAPLVDPILDQIQERVQERDLPPLQQRLKQIEEYLSKDKVPLATLRSACKYVMDCIKENPDTMLELQPTDRTLIVDSYKLMTDSETKAIFEKAAKKKPTRPKMSNAAQSLKAMAKEIEGKLDLDFI